MLNLRRVKRILVVDDDDEMRELIVVLLGQKYDVSFAVNGAQGLEMARALKPDLLVLDLLMPRMHGFEVCQHIRADESLKNTKILISSSKSYHHDIQTAIKETGADGYIIKPFNIADFLNSIAGILGEKPSCA